MSRVPVGNVTSILLCFWLLCGTSSGYDAGQESDLSVHDISTSQTCGPESLYVICRSHGIEVSLETLVKMAKTDAKAGTKVSDLTQAARDLGLWAQYRRTDLASLLADDRMDILLLRDGAHFVVLLGADDSSVYLIEKRERVAVDRKKFEAEWPGVAIIVGLEAPPNWRALTGGALIVVALLTGFWVLRSRGRSALPRETAGDEMAAADAD